MPAGTGDAAAAAKPAAVRKAQTIAGEPPHDASGAEAPAPCDIQLPDGFPKVAVIGGGNLGVTSSAFAAAKGADVSLYIRDSARGRPKLDILKASNNTIPLTPPDSHKRTVKLALSTSDMGEAIRRRHLIFVTTPADGHEAVARAMAPHLERDMMVVLHPGQTYGAFSFVKALRDGGADPEVMRTVSIAELGTSIFTTRSAVDNAEYSALKNFMFFSCFPSDKTGEVFEWLSKMFPSSRLRVLEDTLAMSFHPIAAGPHTEITLTHIGDMAAGKNYLYYREGVDQFNVTLIKKFDDDRCNIARAWGYNPIPVDECLRRMYKRDFDSVGLDADKLTLQELFNKNPAYLGFGSPKDLSTRYFTEEMPCGVLPLLELAVMVGYHAKQIEAVEAQVSALYEEGQFKHDFWAEARSLAKLGLGDLTREQLQEYARTGSLPDGHPQA